MEKTKIRILPVILVSAAVSCFIAGTYIVSDKILLASALAMAGSVILYLGLTAGKKHSTAEIITASAIFVSILMLTLIVCGLVFDFHGILDHAGYYEDTCENGWYHRSYVLGSKIRKSGNILIESYGDRINDVSIDIDGDGEKELVSNTMTFGDGHREAYVYDIENDMLVKKYVDRSALGSGMENGNANSVQTEYLENENLFLIRHFDENGNIVEDRVPYGNISFTYSM